MKCRLQVSLSKKTKEGLSVTVNHTCSWATFCELKSPTSTSARRSNRSITKFLCDVVSFRFLVVLGAVVFQSYYAHSTSLCRFPPTQLTDQLCADWAGTVSANSQAYKAWLIGTEQHMLKLQTQILSFTASTYVFHATTIKDLLTSHVVFILRLITTSDRCCTPSRLLEQ